MSTDFSQGKVWRNIVAQAIPLIMAQMVQILYNIVDRIYIGHLPGENNIALTGVGLTFPVITLILAFSSLVGMGGSTLFAIARGAKEEDKAERIMGNAVSLLVLFAAVLMVVGYAFRKPILYLFGASDVSYPYADAYLTIYLLGTVFSMLTAGLNGFINGQGFPKVGMLTTVIGAVLNLVLDPVFIFGFDMGVRGAALATIISQFVSAVWVIRFLTGKKAILHLKKNNLILRQTLVKDIIMLGTPGFIMQGTNCVVQIVCNATLQTWGGDLYVGIMTILNSVREILSLPVGGIANGAQPVLGYNYGAKLFGRVKAGIRFSALVGFTYTTLAWIFVMICPKFLISVFSGDSSVLAPGTEALHIYFFGFCFMAFQFAGQSVFQALGKAKRAIFFSLFRKVFIVVPLTLILPQMGFGVIGVFLAEPISNAIGGLACFITMWFTLYRKLEDKDTVTISEGV